MEEQIEGGDEILKDKANHRRIRRRVPKRIWDFGLVWEAEIYSRTAGKYGQTPMEKLAGDTLNISECTESEFYNLCWYWENHTDTTEVKIGIWVAVPHKVGSALCYWVLTEKVNIITRTIVQHVTQDEAKTPEIQQSIKNYHITLESSIVADEYMSYLDGMDAFINEEVPS